MNFKISGKIFLSLAIYIISFSAIGQDYINENFIDDIEVNAKPMWAETSPAFKVTAIADKYADESAVIIGYKRHVTLDKKSRMGFFSRGDHSLTFYENVRFKIKLNDRNSVQSFTELYFRYREKEDGFSAHIIKPDGTVSTVSLEEAVKVEQSASIPEFFKSFFDQENESQWRYYKVAVAGLEPGDILEYVTVTTSKLTVSERGYVEFSPQYELCAKNYPILFNQISIETDDKSFFKSMSFNGSPEFKKETAAGDGFSRYVFTDADRGVEKDVNFINEYLVYPMTKFQVIYASSTELKGVMIGQKGEIKTGFTKEELAKKAWEEYEAVGKSYFNNMRMQAYIDDNYAQLKKKDIKTLSDAEYTTKVYYWIRNMVLYRDHYLGDKIAAYIFGSLLYQRGVKSDLVIAASNNTGKIKNILFESEIRYAVKVGDSIYFNCTDHSNPKELVAELLAAEAYIITAPEKNGSQQITPLKLPDATAKENTASFTIDASLDSSLSSLVVLRTSHYNGISKAKNIFDALRYTTYLLEDYKIYGGISPRDKFTGPSSGYYNSVRLLEEQYAEAKPEFVKSELQGEYGQKVTYKSFAVETDGRSLKEKELVYKEGYELGGMIRKAGKKYLVNVPGLVGSQLQVKKEERTRKHDINVTYARTLSWVINFKIPAGYVADGLKELAMNVDNEAGSFSAAAEQKEDTVVITITKVYKKANIEKEKWQDMLAFVDAAYNSSYKYILLKPKN